MKDINLNEFDVSQKTLVSMQIEELKTADVSYIDTCLNWCRLNDIDPSDIAKYINDTLKQKIETEAVEQNLIKGKDKTTTTLKWLT